MIEVSLVVHLSEEMRRLDTFLEDLSRQNFLLDRCELIFINSNSTKFLDDKLSRRYGLNFKLLEHPGIRSSEAKNAGIASSETSSKFFAFLNPNFRLQPDWLKKSIQMLKLNEDFGGLMHEVEIVATRFRFWHPLYNLERFELKRQARYFSSRLPYFTQMFLTRDILDLLGPFDENLGVLSDVDFVLRAFLAKRPLIYLEKESVSRGSEPSFYYREFIKVAKDSRRCARKYKRLQKELSMKRPFINLLTGFLNRPHLMPTRPCG